MEQSFTTIKYIFIVQILLVPAQNHLIPDIYHVASHYKINSRFARSDREEGAQLLQETTTEPGHSLKNKKDGQEALIVATIAVIIFLTICILLVFLCIIYQLKKNKTLLAPSKSEDDSPQKTVERLPTKEVRWTPPDKRLVKKSPVRSEYGKKNQAPVVLFKHVPREQFDKTGKKSKGSKKSSRSDRVQRVDSDDDLDPRFGQLGSDIDLRIVVNPPDSDEEYVPQTSADFKSIVLNSKGKMGREGRASRKGTKKPYIAKTQ